MQLMVATPKASQSQLKDKDEQVGVHWLSASLSLCLRANPSALSGSTAG